MWGVGVEGWGVKMAAGLIRTSGFRWRHDQNIPAWPKNTTK